MVVLPKPEVILTHESDLDGLLAGLLCRRLADTLFGEGIPLQAYHNHNWSKRTLTERSAWVCDLTFEARLDRPDWVIIDHHTTELAPKHAHLVHDLNKSAALLCYELCDAHGLRSETLNRLVHLSNVADLFLEDDPEFALASDYANLVKTYGFWTLEALIQGDPERILDHPLLQVMKVKREVEDPIGLVWAREHVTEVTPTVGLVHSLIGNTNLVVHKMLERKMTPYEVLVTLFRRGTGSFMLSLRSRNGEALLVAERLQGGGHPNAAGALLPRSVQTSGDAVSYMRQVLNPTKPDPRPLNSLKGLFDTVRM